MRSNTWPAGWRLCAACLASALMYALHARGGAAHALGFVALLPWLVALDRSRGLGAALCAGWLMAVAFTLAVFAWFAAAIDAYTGYGLAPALLLLALAAPLLQPQFIAFALAAHLVRRRHGAALAALAGTAAWVACEWLWQKLLGDTLGHGLAPSRLLRQAADLGGAAGLTAALLACNAALAIGWQRRRDGWRGVVAPLGLAVALPLALAGYGAWRLHGLHAQAASPAPSMRIAMVQAAIVDYERRRAESDAYTVVREVLDAHLALSRAALEHHGAEAILWSEAVYPTPFGRPHSAAGAAFDREIIDFVDAAGVPLVFGTFDRDDAGEYNAAAFLEPDRGLLGFYRKTHPFPLTEHVPAWLDRPWLRRALPWAGTWQPGDGARVFPLRTADGRALQVLPLVCLDDVRPALAIEGARLGAQAIVGLSNDAWFSRFPIGAELHLALATFRSIETRLPQLRVTSNGLSAFIDPSGEVLARTAMGDRAVLAGEVPIRDPPPTLAVRWGDWIGPTALALLGLLAAVAAWRRLLTRQVATIGPASALPARVMLLAPTMRWLMVALRVAAAAGLAWIALRMVRVDGLQVNSLDLLAVFGGAVVAPLVVAAMIGWLHRADASIEDDALVLRGARHRIEIPLDRIAALRPWRLAQPAGGFDLVLASGRAWAQGVVAPDPAAFLRALGDAGAAVRLDGPGAAARVAQASARARARHRWLDEPLLKFGLFPLLPALPAFRLHQYIAFGGTFGEWQTYGAGAWLLGLGIWWAAWSLGLMLFAAALRIAIEAIARATGHAARQGLEQTARAIYYAGVPAFLAWRLLLTN